LKNVVPSKKKQDSILAGSHRRASQPDDVGWNGCWFSIHGKNTYLFL
jgi:hypothetical protein